MGQMLAGRLIVSPGIQGVLAQRLALDILGDGLAYQVMRRAILRTGKLLDAGADIRLQLDGDGLRLAPMSGSSGGLQKGGVRDNRTVTSGIIQGDQRISG